jgi:tetratricopeptide (TPR) repeat protein
MQGNLRVMRSDLSADPETTGTGAGKPNTPNAPIAAATAADPDAAMAGGFSPPQLFEFALTASAMGAHQAAIAALCDVARAAPQQAAVWRKLAEQFNFAGDYEAANAAAATVHNLGDGEPPWPAVQDKRPQTQLAIAEKRLREQLGAAPPPEQMDRLRDLLLDRPDAVAAMRLLAQLEWEQGNRRTALALLERVVARTPGYTAARADLATLLFERHEYARAIAETDTLIAQTPAGPQHRSLRAACFRALGDVQAAVAEMDVLREKKSRNPKVQFAYAEALHYAGRRNESIQAYRTCLTLDPAMGEAYWGLAELGGDALAATDIPAMRAHLMITALEPSSRRKMQYALAHALERAGNYEASFAAYQKGAALFRDPTTIRRHDAATGIVRAARTAAVFTSANVASRTPHAAPRHEATPIFLVGMPRAGLRLVEQILASHEQVEATAGLTVMDDVVRDFVQGRGLTRDDFPACVMDLSPVQLAALGADYMQRAAAYRSRGKPYFVDRWAWNWFQVGLINLILPQAKIIDVRRAPMAACFAMFRQILPGEAEFSYDLADLGHYYTAYAGLMRHWDSVVPGRVHALSYENLVDDTEAEIRALLAYCGLPFAPACLRFWESKGSSADAGADRVRRPIFRDSLDQWRHFEPWLAPLAVALREDVAL